jgi:hypothetical protein
MKYRVAASRWDVSPHQVSEFDANSDETATALFEGFKKERQYGYDDLVLERLEVTIVAMSSAESRKS